MTGGGDNLQHIQVVPIQGGGGGGGQQIVLQQAGGQAQVIQTADGQTLLYQPVQVSFFGSVFLLFLIKETFIKDCYKNSSSRWLKNGFKIVQSGRKSKSIVPKSFFLFFSGSGWKCHAANSWHSSRCPIDSGIKLIHFVIKIRKQIAITINQLCY